MANAGDSPPLPMIGTAIGAGEGLAIGAVAYVLFGSAAFAAGIGLVSAAGGALFVPYILSFGAIQEGDIDPGALPAAGTVHSGALGAALSSAAIIGLAARFVVESSSVPLAIALGYAALAFLVLRFVLPDADGIPDSNAELSVQ
ncbi:hypothetical protein ACFQDG_02480 [Natronoarchaeum mannanilyticum]|uniref:Major facilitator superfamily (MFS) profile domain-containing protein n=1 Tax=Natronoarchaeum mannanilyticum TaxID=926360 RepID=A0AAV3T9Q8_9EURY